MMKHFLAFAMALAPGMSAAGDTTFDPSTYEEKLIGTWRSQQDPGFSLGVTADTITDYVKGTAHLSGAWSVVASCVAATGDVPGLVIGFDGLSFEICVEIQSLTEDRMELRQFPGNVTTTMIRQ